MNWQNTCYKNIQQDTLKYVISQELLFLTEKQHKKAYESIKIDPDGGWYNFSGHVTTYSPILQPYVKGQGTQKYSFKNEILINQIIVTNSLVNGMVTWHVIDNNKHALSTIGSFGFGKTPNAHTVTLVSIFWKGVVEQLYGDFLFSRRHFHTNIYLYQVLNSP